METALSTFQPGWSCWEWRVPCPGNAEAGSGISLGSCRDKNHGRGVKGRPGWVGSPRRVIPGVWDVWSCLRPSCILRCQFTGTGLLPLEFQV